MMLLIESIYNLWCRGKEAENLPNLIAGKYLPALRFETRVSFNCQIHPGVRGRK